MKNLLIAPLAIVLATFSLNSTVIMANTLQNQPKLTKKHTRKDRRSANDLKFYSGPRKAYLPASSLNQRKEDFRQKSPKSRKH